MYDTTSPNSYGRYLNDQRQRAEDRRVADPSEIDDQQKRQWCAVLDTAINLCEEEQ